MSYSWNCDARVFKYVLAYRYFHLLKWLRNLRLLMPSKSFNSFKKFNSKITFTSIILPEGVTKRKATYVLGGNETLP